MSDQEFDTNAIALEAAKKVSQDTSTDNLSFESLALLIHAERLNFLEDKITNTFIDLKKRQDEVALLHKLIKMVNMATKDDVFDCSKNEEIKQILEQAKELGIEIADGKYNFSKEERERLLDNIRLTVDDKNILNDMDIQKITRLTTERYESYQLIRSMMKPLHEDKISKARAAGGR